jgi:hypothetical protein
MLMRVLPCPKPCLLHPLIDTPTPFVSDKRKGSEEKIKIGNKLQVRPFDDFQRAHDEDEC